MKGETMDYKALFNEIVLIMHQDYAGKEEKKNWDRPRNYEIKLETLIKNNAIDELIFYDLVWNYLADFKDDHILWRHAKASYTSIGFMTRRYMKSLYVTKVINPKIALKAGMRIVKIDHQDLSYYEEKFPYHLKEKSEERQSWHFILQRAQSVTIEENNQFIEVSILKNIPLETPLEPYEIKVLEPDIVYIRLEDFNAPDTIYDLFEAHKSTLESTPYWIIDVRVNHGGSDNAYAPILPYLFNQGDTLYEEDVYFLMSERNCALRIQLLEQFMAQQSHKPETKEMIITYIEDLKKQRGKGFVKAKSNEPKTFSNTYPNPQKVVVLTDVYCSSSGDQFVYDCKQSEKVHVIGRPTLGVIDYSNLAKLKLKDTYELWYPTSKMASVMRGELLTEGVQPDRYIPWNPSHIFEDVDLIEAKHYLKN